MHALPVREGPDTVKRIAEIAVFLLNSYLPVRPIPPAVSSLHAHVLGRKKCGISGRERMSTCHKIW